jgi:hypothetical protein
MSKSVATVRRGRNIALVPLGILVLLGYQNCNTYSVNSLTEVSSLTCGTPDTPSCTAQGSEELRLTIGNSNPYLMLAGESVIDIGGYCNSAGFSQTRIYFTYTSNGVQSGGQAPNGCDSFGRFRLRLDMGANFNINQIYELTVTLKGVDSKGLEVDNPRLENQRKINITKAGP